MQYMALLLYVTGLILLLMALIYNVAIRIASRWRPRLDQEDKSEVAQLENITTKEFFSEKQSEYICVQQNRIVTAPIELAKAHRIRSIAIDSAVGILQATRKSERKLAKAEAQKLLDTLREELGIEVSKSPEESIQTIRQRLMSLTEMMAEAQLSFCDLDHRVVDIEAIVDQLPSVLESHRDHISSLRDAVNNLRATTATKNELSMVQKELSFYKWTFVSLFGVLFTIIGWIISKVF